jgi:thioredoxin-related protein/outer membrane protein OmpA-like peptidoglycan-associated protein
MKKRNNNELLPEARASVNSHNPYENEVKQKSKSLSGKKLLFPILLLLTAMHALGQIVDFKNLTLTEAKVLALKQNKPLYVDFYTTWCSPCKQMERDVFADSAVATYMNEHFVSIRIDAEKQDQAQVRALKISAYPTSLFYTASGKLNQRHEGYLNAIDFLQSTSGLVNFAKYEKAYERRPNEPENVYNYLSALELTNPTRAQSLAHKYIAAADEKTYTEPYTWKLIQNFIEPKDRFLFGKVIAHQLLPLSYPEEFRRYLLLSVKEKVNVSIEQKKSSLLAASVGYVQNYPQYFGNPDSLQLVFKLQYANELQTPELAPLLRAFADAYVRDNDKRLSFAMELVETHFKNDVLTYAEELAENTIRVKPTAKAYVVKALANEEMSNFTTAYGNIMLAYAYADADVTTVQLDEFKKQINEKLTSEYDEGVNPNNRGNYTKDGRFTLGAGKKRLMYGYPVPESTSHFVVNINGKLASNASHFEGPVGYLTGVMKYEGLGATPRVTVEYQFEKIIIRQVLTPVDKDGKEVTTGFAQYYHISYQFQNTQGVPCKIGLAVLFDTMVDDNDNCNIMAGRRPVQYETMFTGSEVPEALQFYRTPRDTSDMMGEALLKGPNITTPDRLVVGRWPVLHNLTWKLTAARVPYDDSAYLLQWKDQPLLPHDKLTISTLFGLPKFKKPELQALMKGELYLTKSASIYFQPASDELDLNSIMTLNALAEDKDIIIRGVSLNGYADITGEGAFNFDLSKKRIAAVAKIFEANQIAVMPKAYGIDAAQRNEFDKLYGNVWDRRVDVIVYYRKKSNQLVLTEIPNGNSLLH